MCLLLAFLEVVDAIQRSPNTAPVTIPPLNQVVSKHHSQAALSPAGVRNAFVAQRTIDTPPFSSTSFSSHSPTIVSLPQTPNHKLVAQNPNSALLLLPQPRIVAKDLIKTRVSKAITKTKHQIAPSMVGKNSASPTYHAAHRTAGPVLEQSLQNPNASIISNLASPNDANYTMMLSRQNKRRPRTQECGDQASPEFKQHNKFQIAGDEDQNDAEGIASDDSDL